MVSPTVNINILCFNNLLTTFLWKSLTSSNRCLISSWGSFHLFCSDQWRCNSLRFLGFFLWVSILRNIEIFFSRFSFFSWFFLHLLRQFLLNWSLIFFFLDKGFLDLRSALDIGFCNRFKILGYWLSFLYWRFLFLKLRISLNNWRFSLSDRWFHSSFTLETLDNFFKSKSRFLKINFEFKSILLRYLNFLLKSVLAIGLELINKDCGVNIDATKFIFLIGIFFIEFESKEYFSVFVKVREVEIELTTSEGHDTDSISIDEISFSHYFILIKLLHSWIRKELPL